MNVVNIAVYKEAKQNKQFRDRVRQEKIRELYSLAERAMEELDQDAMDELAGAIYDGNNTEIGSKVNRLIFKGGLFKYLDGVVGNYQCN